MVRVGRKRGQRSRGGLQCVFGCRFEGEIDSNTVYDLVKEQLDLGVDELALADSTGMANPVAIRLISTKVLETDLAAVLLTGKILKEEGPANYLRKNGDYLLAGM